MCIGDVAGHSGQGKEGACRKGDIFNEEVIGKEYELASFVLDLEQSATTINESVLETNIKECVFNM
jgi:hypothetical protein